MFYLEVFKMNKSFIFLVSILLFCSGCSTFSSKSRGNDYVIRFEQEEQVLGEYSILAYQKLSKDEKLPLILILHGQGGNGSRYLELWREEAAKSRVMLLAPTWGRALHGQPHEKMEDFLGLLDHVVRQYPVDDQRVAVAGVSAGALIARWLLEKDPQRWAAAVLVAYASGQDKWLKLDVAQSPPIFFVHGKKDPQFTTEQLEKDVEGLRRQGLEVKWYEDSKAGHEHSPKWTKKIMGWLSDKDF